VGFVGLALLQVIGLDDDVLNEDWINYRTVRSHVSAITVTVLVTIGVGRRIQKK
jgi:hypothetical protein